MGNVLVIRHAFLRLGWMNLEIGRLTTAGSVSSEGGSTSVSWGGGVGRFLAMGFVFRVRTVLRVAAPLLAFCSLFERRTGAMAEEDEKGGGSEKNDDASCFMACGGNTVNL